MKKLLVTGSAGLIGSEVTRYFADKGWQIHGIDNNERAVFFGKQGDTTWNNNRLLKTVKNYFHYDIDIRKRDEILKFISSLKPDAVVHTAAQPSHDKASQIPFEDFDNNAVGTLNILEATRRCSSNIPFVHLSTNKVYGDAPNQLPLIEKDTRWEYADPKYKLGINETFTIDQSVHSLFGASKLAADIMVQEYGNYFNMPTCCLRGGCLTGPNHSGVELHGFLNYLVKCNIESKEYSIFGYKGKQVRDNIHSYDVARFVELFLDGPKFGEVYNLGGGKANTCSILEAFTIVEKYTQLPMIFQYEEKHRMGDHVCYYSDLTKIKSHFPSWEIQYSIEDIIEELVLGLRGRD